MRRWLGLKALVHDAIDATSGLVREGHEATARTVVRVTDLIPPLAGPARAVDDARRFGTDATIASVMAVNRVVERLTDLGLHAAIPAADVIDEPAVPMRSDILDTPAWIADAALGAVNGAIGDHLARQANGLDLGLQLRLGDRYLTPGDPIAGPLGSRIVILVHGLGTTEWCWALDAAAFHGDPTTTFGTMLARDRGLVPVYARYNTGRRIGANGAALCDAIAAMVRDWPVPVDEIVLLGHSMGGLVSRSACDVARKADLPWLAKLSTVISLGSPHQGAPLARFARSATGALAAVDLPATQISARILEARSGGVQDLEHGDLGAEADPPLLDHVRYVFLAGTVTQDPANPLGAWLGDLLVRESSASGPPIPTPGGFTIHTATFGGQMHHQLHCHPDVYARLLTLL